MSTTVVPTGRVRAAARGAYKGLGLAVAVEVLTALLSGAARGPSAAALNGDPTGQDDDIGVLALAIDPRMLRPGADFAADPDEPFATLLACPPVDPDKPVRYSGWPEGELASRRRTHDAPLPDALYRELLAAVPETVG